MNWKTEAWLLVLGLGAAVVGFAGMLALIMGITCAFAVIGWFLYNIILVPCIPVLPVVGFWAIWAILFLIHILALAIRGK